MRILVLAAALLAAPVAEAVERPIVVELFTSQGCSSCPPADAYLRELASRRDVLPLAFHVTYWNRLGWRDPYALTSATARQEAYAGRLGETAFTPQMIIDGRSSVIGSRRAEVGAAIAKAKGQAGAGVSVALGRGPSGLSIAVGRGAGAGRVLLVGFDRQRTTAVGRGENSGRTLIESNIVRSIREIGAWRGAALDLSEAVPAGEDAAVILQAADGSILGASRL